MIFLVPVMLVVAVLLVAALAVGYVVLERRRTAALAASGFGTVATRGAHRHLPFVLVILAVGLLTVAGARPQASVEIPRAAGTVILAFDVSASMAATDIDPSRLAAAQRAAIAFVEAQPATVDIGVVSFAGGALLTQAATDDNADAIAAINRLSTSGSTSLGQPILASLSAITGETVSLAEEGADAPDLGYWGSATIVLFSDGEQTSDPAAGEAAALAATAGVHIETVGVGTTQGTTLDIDGYQVSTALDEQSLETIAKTTSGSYHALSEVSEIDSIASSIDLRITAQKEDLELTAIVAALALLLLFAAGVVMVIRTGRLI